MSKAHTFSHTAHTQKEIERLEGELKGSTAMERIYKETIEQKDNEIKTKNTKIQTLEVRCSVALAWLGLAGLGLAWLALRVGLPCLALPCLVHQINLSRMQMALRSESNRCSMDGWMSMLCSGGELETEGEGRQGWRPTLE